MDERLFVRLALTTEVRLGLRTHRSDPGPWTSVVNLRTGDRQVSKRHGTLIRGSRSQFHFERG
jgi:hypothetical protein